MQNIFFRGTILNDSYSYLRVQITTVSVVFQKEHFPNLCKLTMQINNKRDEGALTMLA